MGIEEGGFPGMRRFQPEPGTSKGKNNKQEERGGRRAGVNSADPDGWIDVNEVRQQRVHKSVRGQGGNVGKKNKNPKIQEQEDGDRNAANTNNGIGSIGTSERRTGPSASCLESWSKFLGIPIGELRIEELVRMPVVSCHGYDNWTVARLFSEELYSVLEKHYRFNGEYLSAGILSEIFWEKTRGNEEFCRDRFSLGVKIEKIHELFRFGQTGIRLEMKGSVFPKSGVSGSSRSVLEEIHLSANDELAELLKKVLEPGDILQIFGEPHLKGSRVIHLNIDMSGEILICHYRHNMVFSPNTEAGSSDLYNQIHEPCFLIVKHEESSTEHRVEIKPAKKTNEDSVFTPVDLVERRSQSPGPSTSQPKSQEVGEMIEIEDEQPLLPQQPRSSHPKETEKPTEPANPLSAELFEQSLSSIQSSGKPGSGSGSDPPNTCDSTDYVMRALFPEDEPNPVSTSQGMSNTSKESQILLDSSNGIEILVQEPDPEDNQPFLESQQHESPHDSLEHPEDSQQQSPLIMRKETIREPENTSESGTLSEANAINSKSPNPREEVDDEEEFVDAVDDPAIIGMNDTDDSIYAYLAKDTEDLLIPEPGPKTSSRPEPEPEPSISNAELFHNTQDSIYNHLAKDSEDFIMEEPEPLENGNDPEKDPAFEITPDVSSCSENGAGGEPIPPIFTGNPELTQYFDEYGEPTPGPSVPDPPEDPMPEGDQPPSKVSPEKYKRKKKKKGKKVQKHVPIMNKHRSAKK